MRAPDLVLDLPPRPGDELLARLELEFDDPAADTFDGISDVLFRLPECRLVRDLEEPSKRGASFPIETAN